MSYFYWIRNGSQMLLTLNEFLARSADPDANMMIQQTLTDKGKQKEDATVVMVKAG